MVKIRGNVKLTSAHYTKSEKFWLLAEPEPPLKLPVQNNLGSTSITGSVMPTHASIKCSIYFTHLLFMLHMRANTGTTHQLASPTNFHLQHVTIPKYSCLCFDSVFKHILFTVSQENLSPIFQCKTYLFICQRKKLIKI